MSEVFPLRSAPTPADASRVFRFRRVVSAALEDFGVRRRDLAGPSAPEATTTVEPGVVWRGEARRSEELVRFCAHLEAVRAAAH